MRHVTARRIRKPKAAEVSTMPYRPSMTVSGPAARKLFKRRPGDRVVAHVHGRLVNIGVRTYEKGNPPTAEIQIDRTIVR